MAKESYKKCIVITDKGNELQINYRYVTDKGNANVFYFSNASSIECILCYKIHVIQTGFFLC